ncbi:MAG TPA: hypothetical protein VFI25_19940 [Planctomycetota bacterium]|jgi:hypothetical protein|nr:hypothetical protein [Planctomycetota bacterium]
MKERTYALAALAVLGSLGFPAAAQTGATAGVDGSLGILGSSLAYQGRIGTFPNGQVRMSMATTSCNPGNHNLIWFAAPSLPHPVIGFMAARVEPGATRITQVSDRSWVKHAFFALSSNQCSTCQCPSNGSWLGVACSDTYSTGNNASSLGPPDDYNPWTGVWTPGIQPTGGSTNTVRMTDGDLIVPGATYFYCADYVFSSWVQASVGASCTSGGSPIPQPVGTAIGLKNEPDGNRTNNLASRQMTVTYSAGVPTFTNAGAAQLAGTVLQRWTGATINSSANGDPTTGPSDGRVYVAVKVTGPTNGLYHYEYAVHNRDNKGGIGAIHFPTCPSAVLSGLGFHDTDVPLNAANNWTTANGGPELVYTSPAGNSLRWNAIYNFWFDSDAAPVSGNVTLDQATIVGGVSPSFTVATTVPGALYNENLGPGCGDPSAPTLFAGGAPARATLGNATFSLNTAGNSAAAPTALFISSLAGTFPLGGACTLYSSSLGTIFPLLAGVCDGTGFFSWSIPVPNDPSMEGADLDWQAVSVSPPGAYLGTFDLSNGLRVRIGSATTTCP